MNAPRPSRIRSEAAFTMVEVALCIAIIGFALVAIIGVLPTGLRVQKDNRDDSVLGQDATVWLEFLKNPPLDTFNGAPYQAADYLTNHVTQVVAVYTNSSGNLVTNPAGALQINRGWKILGLLCNPTNQVTYADMRAISGTAADRGTNQPTAFSYRLFCQVTNAAVFTPEVANSLYEVRLTFRWPVFPNGSVGDGRRTYRTMVSGNLRYQPGPDRYYLEPLIRTNAL
jgi:hypothetical protein